MWLRSHQGGDIPALVEAVKAANDRRTALSQELAVVDSQQHSDADYDQLEKDLQAHFEASWKTLLTRQVGPTRQILRKLFNEDRLPFIPMTNESGSQYEFRGTASIRRLLTGRAKELVSPTGINKRRSIHLASALICWYRPHDSLAISSDRGANYGNRSNRRWARSSALKFKGLLWRPKSQTSGLGM